MEVSISRVAGNFLHSHCDWKTLSSNAILRRIFHSNRKADTDHRHVRRLWSMTSTRGSSKDISLRHQMQTQPVLEALSLSMQWLYMSPFKSQYGTYKVFRESARLRASVWSKYLPSYEVLQSVDWELCTGVSEQTIGTTFEGQAVHEAFCFDCLTIDMSVNLFKQHPKLMNHIILSFLHIILQGARRSGNVTECTFCAFIFPTTYVLSIYLYKKILERLFR